MKDLLERLNIDTSLQGTLLLEALETERKNILSQLSNPDNDYEQEKQLHALLSEISDAKRKIEDSQFNNVVETSEKKLISIEDSTFTVKKLTHSEAGAAHAEGSEYDELDDIVEKADEAYENENYSSAYELFSQAAERGNSYAMYSLGFMYSKGQGVQQNIQMALKWHKQAVENGNANAADFLINFLENLHWQWQVNNIIPLNLYIISAENGNETSMFKLGEAYWSGQWMDVNYIDVLDFYIKQSDTKISDNDEKIIKASAKEIPKDIEKAIAWYAKAAENGSGEAINALRNINNMVKNNNYTGSGNEKSDVYSYNSERNDIKTKTTVSSADIRPSRIVAYGTGAFFFFTLILSLVLMIIYRDYIENFHQDIRIFIPVVSFIAALTMAVVYLGIVFASKKFWTIYALVFTKVFAFILSIYNVLLSILGAFWWTVVAALMVIAIMLGLLIGIIAFALFFGVIFGILGYLIAIVYTGFIIGVYKLGEAIWELRAYQRIVHERSISMPWKSAKPILIISQILFSVGTFAIMFFSDISTEFWYEGAEYLDRVINAFGMITLFPLGLYSVFFGLPFDVIEFLW